MRGAFAGCLSLESIAVLFVPRAIAQFGPGLTATRLTVLLVLAGTLLVTAFSLRRRGALAVGSALQVALLGTGLLAPAMFAVGAVFGLVWIYLLRLRRDLLGPGAGPRPAG